MKLTSEEDKEWSSLSKETRKKEDQQLKYVDQHNTHRPSTFKSVATDVYSRLSQLTSYSDSTAKKSIDKLYPDHAKALNAANLVNGRFPKFGEIWENQTSDRAIEEKKKKQKENRNIYFVMGFSNVCRFL
eukprot:11901539-Ditylum_brightwellii.AAC.1